MLGQISRRCVVIPNGRRNALIESGQRAYFIREQDGVQTIKWISAGISDRNYDPPATSFWVPVPIPGAAPVSQIALFQDYETRSVYSADYQSAPAGVVNYPDGSQTYTVEVEHRLLRVASSGSLASSTVTGTAIYHVLKNSQGRTTYTLQSAMGEKVVGGLVINHAESLLHGIHRAAAVSDLSFPAHPRNGLYEDLLFDRDLEGMRLTLQFSGNTFTTEAGFFLGKIRAEPGVSTPWRSVGRTGRSSNRFRQLGYALSETLHPVEADWL